MQKHYMCLCWYQTWLLPSYTIDLHLAPASILRTPFLSSSLRSLTSKAFHPPHPYVYEFNQRRWSLRGEATARRVTLLWESRDWPVLSTPSLVGRRRARGVDWQMHYFFLSFTVLAQYSSTHVHSNTAACKLYSLHIEGRAHIPPSTPTQTNQVDLQCENIF